MVRGLDTSGIRIILFVASCSPALQVLSEKKKGVYFEGKEIAPKESNLFPFVAEPLRKKCRTILTNEVVSISYKRRQIYCFASL